MTKKTSQLFNEFTVLWAFVFIALAGLAIGAVSSIALSKSAADDGVLPSAPPVEEYRTEARDVVAPFLGQAAVIGDGVYPEGAASVMTDLVDLTQERLLGMTVPASERDVHLSMVILLDQWRRALKGTGLDLAGVVSRTDGLLLTYPWLAPL